MWNILVASSIKKWLKKWKPSVSDAHQRFAIVSRCVRTLWPNAFVAFAKAIVFKTQFTGSIDLRSIPICCVVVLYRSIDRSIDRRVQVVWFKVQGENMNKLDTKTKTERCGQSTDTTTSLRNVQKPAHKKSGNYC